MRPAAGKTFTSLMITVAGVVGAVLLLAASAHHPAEAAFLRVGALVWFLAAGVARLVFDVTELSDPDAEAATPATRPDEAEPSRFR